MSDGDTVFTVGGSSSTSWLENGLWMEFLVRILGWGEWMSQMEKGILEVGGASMSSGWR